MPLIWPLGYKPRNISFTLWRYAGLLKDACKCVIIAFCWMVNFYRCTVTNSQANNKRSHYDPALPDFARSHTQQIGRASCRERVSMSVMTTSSLTNNVFLLLFCF